MLRRESRIIDITEVLVGSGASFIHFLYPQVEELGDAAAQDLDTLSVMGHDSGCWSL